MKTVKQMKVELPSIGPSPKVDNMNPNIKINALREALSQRRKNKIASLKVLKDD